MKIFLYLFSASLLIASCNTPVKDTSPPSLHELIAGVEPGDTLQLPSGIFQLDSSLQIVKEGTSELPIVILGQPDMSTILDASNIRDLPTPATAVWVAGSHVHVKDLVVRNSHDVGILVGTKEYPSRSISLENCRVENTYGSGIGLWYVDTVLVSHCEIIGANDQEMRRPGVKLQGEAPHEALTVAGATHFSVVFNEIYDCQKEGIDIKEVSSHGVVHHNYVHDMPRQGLYADAWFGLLEDVEFRYNVVHDCEWGAVISVEGEGSRLENVSIHNNLLYNNVGSGIFFGQWGNDLLRENIEIYNNTVVNNGTEGHWAGLTGGIDIRSASIRDLSVHNNISVDNYGFGIASFAPTDQVTTAFEEKNIRVLNNLIQVRKDLEPVESDYNLNYELTGIDPIIEEPQFTDADALIFTLKDSSPAKNKSINTDVPRDLGADMSEIRITLEQAGNRK